MLEGREFDRSGPDAGPRPVARRLLAMRDRLQAVHWWTQETLGRRTFWVNDNCRIGEFMRGFGRRGEGNRIAIGETKSMTFQNHDLFRRLATQRAQRLTAWWLASFGQTIPFDPRIADVAEGRYCC